MQRRMMGKTNEEVSLLGFGCMRLPTLANGEIDEAEAIAMIRYAIDHGVNYLDTAYGYHDGKSEVLVGKAIQDGYREKVNIATKLPVWLVKEPQDCARLFNEQLERLGVEMVDFYLLHALNRNSWQQALENEALEVLEQMQAEGRIRHVGFSFHDDLPAFREIIDAYPWDFCQIQFNYMDECHQAGLAGLKYAASKGLGVVIMEPLRGGRLVQNLPPEVEELFKNASVQRTPAEWALRWVADHPEVSIILSGMSRWSDVKENLRVLSEAEPQSLSKEELAVIAQAQEIYNQRVQIPCTDCRYCLPCPQNVAIPRIFRLFNEASMYNSFDGDRFLYEQLVSSNKDASQCIACGNCESVCPQQLEIIELLQMADRAFAVKA
ncbi:MAG: aldo/keto reductase [Limnochordia bacterium]|nr:aldo/keto reductase [Bacillota bacterium]NLL08684.1 aldo/keto reductase [Bacillota bacterium]HBG10059.1 aldo/keto reductase [Bacillota bacterium]